MQRASNYIALTLALGGALLLAISVWGLWSSEPPAPRSADGSVASTRTGFAVPPTAAPGSGAPSDSGPQTGQAPLAQASRLVVPSVEIDALIAILGVDADGVMQSPAAPDVVGMYDFSAKPGEGGNTVLSGHVDYAGYGPAVFWRLRELKAGDEIDLVLDAGTTVRYSVLSIHSYPAADAPVGEIVGPTLEESLTLITCGGSFDKSSRQYSDRLVVRAVRNDDGATSALSR